MPWVASKSYIMGMNIFSEFLLVTNLSNKSAVAVTAVRLRRKVMKVLMAAKESWYHKLSFKTSFAEIG